MEVAKPDIPVPAAFHHVPYTFKPAIELAVSQQADGVWNEALMATPPARAEGFEGVGTVHAVRRLLEYGWDRESPPIAQARRLLFRLLAEDDDPAMLYEFLPKVTVKGKIDEEQAPMVRQYLREAAGAALAQAGYESDPRLRGAARRTLDRITEFLKSPLAEKPWIRVGNQQVLAPDAFPPSIHALLMLSHMPLFRSEYYDAMERLYRWLVRPLPRQEQIQLVGTRHLNVPWYVMGDRLPHRNAVEADVPAAMAWLELMARMGFLRRNENWLKMYERFVDDCGRDGVWHPHKGMALPKTAATWVWATYPLEPSQGGEERWADMTFRIGLIARIIGRPIDLV